MTKSRSDVATLVKEDIEKRIEKGVKEYGERLQTHNGRDALNDVYEEILDAALYLRQKIEEDNEPPCTTFHEIVPIWTYKHINGNVWVIGTDMDLDIEKIYQTTATSTFTFKHFKVVDQYKPDSLYRYIITGVLNKPTE